MNFLENKIPPPIVALLFGFMMWFFTQHVIATPASDIVVYSISSLCISVGVFFMLSAVLSFRLAKTTVNPLKPSLTTALVTTGVYQYSRNPMYVGLAFFLAAWANYLATMEGYFGIMGYLLYIQRFQIQPEEKILESLFTQAFLDYKAQVRCWL